MEFLYIYFFQIVKGMLAISMLFWIFNRKKLFYGVEKHLEIPKYMKFKWNKLKRMVTIFSRGNGIVNSNYQ